MSSIVCKKHAHCETTLPLKDRWREPKQQINARGPNICSQQKTWRVHFKQGILNGIVTGMRFMLAGVDSQERRILQCQEKKFAMVFFGFTLGEIHKTCRRNSVIVQQENVCSYENGLHPGRRQQRVIYSLNFTGM